MVAKIAASFGSRLISPKEDLSIEWKKDVTRDFPVKNAHERDALAAAIYAYKSVESKIRKIKADIRKKESEIIARTLLGEPLASVITERAEKPKEIENAGEVKRLKKEVEKSKRLIRELKSKLKVKPKIVQVKGISINAKNSAMEKKLAKLERRVKRLGELLELVLAGKLALADEPPPGHIVIEKIGNVYITKEKEGGKKKVDEKKLEELIEEYRKRRLENKVYYQD